MNSIRFTTSLVDLMTVLFLTVIALIADQRQPSPPAGDVRDPFVLISGTVTANRNVISSFVWKEEGNPIANLDGIAVGPAAQLSAPPQKDGVFALIDFARGEKETVTFSAFITSVGDASADPSNATREIMCMFTVDGGAVLKVDIVSLHGLEKSETVEIGPGEHQLLFTSRKTGNLLTTSFERRAN